MGIFEIIKIVLVLGIFVSFGYFIYDYRETKAENTRLANEIKEANKTITALDNLSKAKAEIQQKTDNLLDEIDKEPETNDADTAPVLFNSIMRLHQ